MAIVYVEVDLYEFDDKDLIEELENRGYTIKKDNEEEDNEVSEPSKNRLPSSYTIERCFDRYKLRSHLENIAGCGSVVSNEELLKQLKYLLENG